MEEKRNEIFSCFRSFSGNRNVFRFFSGFSNNSKSHGFTLIELVIVIGIIGILSASIILLIDPVKQLQRSNDNKRRSDLKQIQAALELYRSDENQYPTVEGALANCGGSGLMDEATCTTTYIQNIPKDPSGVDYYYEPDGNGYNIYGCSESSASDPEIIDAPSLVSTFFGDDCPSPGGTMKVFMYTNP